MLESPTLEDFILRSVCVLTHFSHVQLCATPWTVARQAPLSMGFSRREYWSGLPFPPPGDLPDPGIKPRSLTSPALAGVSSTTSAPWEALKMSPFLFLRRSPALLSQAGSRISSADCFALVLWNNKEMGSCKSFLEADCFDTVNFSILPKQISPPFSLFHHEMTPFSNSVLDTTPGHCNSRRLSEREEAKEGCPNGTETLFKTIF